MSEFNPYAAPKAEIGGPGADQLAPYLEGLVFPLSFTFRILTFAPSMEVVDATGRTLLYARQKLFKLKEHVEIFTDRTRTTRLAEIRANKVIDWTARYNFADAWGGEIGAVGRKGWRSIWRAHYEVFNPGDTVADYVIREENPFAKLMDGFLGEIPILGLLTMWLFHPRYLATAANGTPAVRLEKRPAFLARKFTIDKLCDLTPRQTMNLLLAFFMLTLLERRRGRASKAMVG